jgi:riboflavin kinase/FMN adenylyltransferase
MNCVLALGFFDGVHLGHGALLRRAVEAADGLGLPSRALTLDIHPDRLLLGRTKFLLSSPADRERLMRELYGIGGMMILPFTRQTMLMPWDSFVKDVLVGQYGARHLVAGYNYHFGHRGEGRAERLQGLCREIGIGCDVVSPVSLDGIPVSSTHIRRLVAQGDMARARDFLGHPHCMTGIVTQGRGVGAELGAPTANVPLPEDWQQPAFGVYFSRIRVWDGDSCDVYNGVTNIGLRPTFGLSAGPVAESVLFGYQGSLYGRAITIELLEFHRPEQTFATPEALREQIKRDLETAHMKGC